MFLNPVLDNSLLEDLTDDYSLQLVPRAPQWWVSDTIIPTALVSSSVILQAKLTQTVESFASEQEKTNPASGTVLADTGQLAAGEYKARIYYSKNDGTSNMRLAIEHRDAPNTGNVLQFLVLQSASDVTDFGVFEMTRTIALNERFRVEVLDTGTGGTYMAMIFFSLLPS